MKKHDLKIHGSGSAGGGSFHRVLIRGEGMITGNIDCEKFSTHGTSELSGDAKIKSFSVHGETEIRGRLKADKARVYGTADVSENAEISDAAVKGIINIGGNMTADTCDVKGALNVRGDCEAEDFKLTGSLDVKGLLNAGVIDIGLKYGNSSIGDIGGTDIKIVNKRGLLFNRNGGTLSAGTIEDIYLENTAARMVRGNRVHIGPGCKIEKVEYKSSYRVSPKSEVNEDQQQ
ncbi:hypothetical protein [Bacillus licheniformis]|uniref:hypothetical protein n=1 Tax=Bacillus licheniformis TaxID=1402 RepID=UPI000FF8F598|nr:hypothetical protein [Bacillus licheniformis]QAS15335.1 hypothetical protein EQJ69_05275 [Bacillus licheniformis]